MKVLIVGAGAVGQAYGVHLSQGGADVSFYVKDKYVAKLREGLTLFPLNTGRNPVAVNWNNFNVISEMSGVSGSIWDVILLTLPSNALYNPWLEEFAKHVDPKTLIVTLQPGHNDRLELLKYFPEKNLIPGVITLISFETPLDPQGPQQKGIAYWFPPSSKGFFDGDAQVIKDLIKTLNKGGFPAGNKQLLNNPGLVYFGSTFLNVFIRNLENNQWKLDAFKDAEAALVLKDSTLEAFEIIARKNSLTKPFFHHFLGKTFYLLAIYFSKKLMPFDLEKYLQVHFTKVAPQMHKNFSDLIQEGQDQGLSIKTLLKLKS